MQDKSFAIRMLPVPVLTEAVNGVLYIHNLIDPTHGVVPAYEGAAHGDNVKLEVRTTTGNSWAESVTLSSTTVGKPVEFKIPKKIFEENLVPQAGASVQYIVTSNDISKVSLQLNVHLEG